MGLFVFKLPQGKNWYDLHSNASSISFSKAVDSRDSTFTASAYVRKIKHKFNTKKQFLNYVKSSSVRNAIPENFNLLKHDEKIDSSLADYCTKFIIKANKKGRERERSQDRQIIEKRGYSCLHPKHRDLMVTIEYSIKSKFFYVSRETLLEGENFIKSLTFK